MGKTKNIAQDNTEFERLLMDSEIQSQTISLVSDQKHYFNPLKFGVQESASVYAERVVGTLNELAKILKEFTLNEDEIQALTEELIHSYNAGNLHDFHSLIQRLTIINTTNDKDLNRLIDLLKISL